MAKTQPETSNDALQIDSKSGPFLIQAAILVRCLVEGPDGRKVGSRREGEVASLGGGFWLTRDGRGGDYCSWSGSGGWGGDRSGHGWRGRGDGSEDWGGRWAGSRQAGRERRSVRGGGGSRRWGRGKRWSGRLLSKRRRFLEMIPFFWGGFFFREEKGERRLTASST